MIRYFSIQHQKVFKSEIYLKMSTFFCRRSLRHKFALNGTFLGLSTPSEIMKERSCLCDYNHKKIVFLNKKVVQANNMHLATMTCLQLSPRSWWICHQVIVRLMVSERHSKLERSIYISRTAMCK